MRFAGRFAKEGERYHGLVNIAKNKRAIWSGVGRFETHMLGLPLSWRAPSTVFVNSMSDLFYDQFTNEQIAATFGVMAACRRHTFIVLTKRAERLPDWFEWVATRAGISGPGAEVELCVNCADEEGAIGERIVIAPRWPLPNVVIGVSVEDRKHGVPRIDYLRRTPAAVRMLSVEPLLECLGDIDLTDIGWVVAGAESGPGARPCPVDALREVRDQCESAGVPFWLKQAVELRGQDAGPGVQRGDSHPIAFGRGSKWKPGKLIELPYLDGEQHTGLPVMPSQ